MSEIAESDRIAGALHPREQPSLHGHQAALAAVVSALASGRMPHGWLIGGPPGIGKATLAYRLARAVLRHGDCDVPAGLVVPPDDAVFRRVAAQAHPDLLVLRRPWDFERKKLKTALPVDEVRRLHGFVGHHASAGGWRVAIVDTADEMNDAAANALLKVLEEPPSRTLILLVSHAPGRLLPTIRSRCRALALRPLADADLAAAIAAGAPDLDREAARRAAVHAAGSPGRAIALAGGDGLAMFQAVAALLDAAPEIDSVRLHALADGFAGTQGEERWSHFTDAVEAWVERRARAGAGTAAWLDAYDAVRAAVAQADGLHLDRRHTALGMAAAIAQAARSASGHGA